MNNPPPPTEPLVVYVDIDAFFASVEQLLIPAIRNRPVVVGNGCIASCSYEARRFGLRAGMPIRQAVRMCPEAVVLDGSYPIYRCFAEGVWDVCRQYTCGLETFLDEAYGDAGGMERLYGAPVALGRALQRRVIEEVGLAVSVGLAIPHAIVDQLPQRADRMVTLNYRHHCYDVINQRLDLITSQISGTLQRAGHRAWPVPASQTVDEKRL